MKIISWNVNGIRSVMQKGFLDFMNNEKPDILGLQETKAHRDQIDSGVVQPPGWHSYWSSAQRKGYSGTATYCRTEPTKVDYGIEIPKYDAEGRFVVTQFADLRVYNVYFPNGGSGDERHQFKQEFLLKFTMHLKRQIESGLKVVVMGDYNVAYLDIDVFDPKRCSKVSGFYPEERQWFNNFLSVGFIDTFRFFHPDDKDIYTWWSYQENARISNRGWRIDHICVSKNLEPSLKSCRILDSQEGSDHCPIALELTL